MSEPRRFSTEKMCAERDRFIDPVTELFKEGIENLSHEELAGRLEAILSLAACVVMEIENGEIADQLGESMVRGSLISMKLSCDSWRLKKAKEAAENN